MKRRVWRVLWVLLAIAIFSANTVISSHAVEKHEVYVAKTFIPQGAIIQKDSVKLQEIPVEKIEKDTFSPGDEEDMLGRKVDIPLLEGEQVRVAKLSKNQVNTGIYSEITIELDNPADAGRAEKGDFVDIWVNYGRSPQTIRIKKGQEQEEKNAEKVLTKMLVRSVRDKNNVEIEQGKRSLPRYVTFDATDSEIKLIKEKQAEGTLFLTVQGRRKESSGN